MEIFNFFRKFESNLQNELGGNSVISRNSSPTTAPPPASFLRSSRRICDRPWLRTGTSSSLRVVPSYSWPRYKAPTPSSTLISLLCFPPPPLQLRRAILASSAQDSPRKAVSQFRLLLAPPTDQFLPLDFTENSLSTFFFLAAGDLDRNSVSPRPASSGEPLSLLVVATASSRCCDA